MRTALTIAGSDSGGGAGLQADLKTFAAHAVFGTSAVTAITVQNTVGVTEVLALSPHLVEAQIVAVLDDLGAETIKTGMLATGDIVDRIAALAVSKAVATLVVDPVLVATSGARLLDADGVVALRERLLPLATVVTPNIAEAEALTGISIRSEADRRAAARTLREFGPASVVITGGHFPSDSVEDLYYDGHRYEVFHAERHPANNIHGAGCTFSAALAAHLALGSSVAAAVPRAQAFVGEAIRHGARRGAGALVLNHAWGSTPPVY